jgi:PAS domain S-box-containing protein
VLSYIAIGLICGGLLIYAAVRYSRTVTKLKHGIAGLHNDNSQLLAKTQLHELAEQITHIGTWEFFVDTQALNWSDELYRIYGYDKSKTYPDKALNDRLVAPEYREKVSKAIEAAIQSKSGFAVEYQIIQPLGLRKYILGQGSFVEHQNKLVGAIQDITELKEAVLKLKINETLLREAEKVSHSGSWEWIEGKDYILWSDEMYNIHGLFPHSVAMSLGEYENLVHEDDVKEVFSQLRQAHTSKGSLRINYRIVRPSGEVRHVLSSAEYKRIGINDNFAYIGTTQDVTELREAQVQLEEKISALNRSNQDLEQFAYVASHDLQEPLRKIQAFGGKLRDRHAAQLNEEGLDYLARMNQAAERMRTLINDLLTFSKATRDGKRFTLLNVGELIRKTVQEMDYTIEQKSAVVDIDAEISVPGVQAQLHQLFQNLIGNALKFTVPGTLPHIRISACTAMGAQLQLTEVVPGQSYAVIEIADNGIGFDRDDSERIFDLFHRQHARSAYEGTGIGLAICKKIVSYHNGFIYADSRPGSGAVFTVVLPKKQTKAHTIVKNGTTQGSAN